MDTVFIETSALNWLYDNTEDANHANRLLEMKKLIPIVGMDTIYELAHCFLNSPNRASNLFEFLKQFKPVYSCQRENLYNQELDRFLNGTSVNVFLEHYSKEILTNRIGDYSSGIFNEIHRDFIIARQFFWDDCREKLWIPKDTKRKRGLEFIDYLPHCLKKIEENITIFQQWILGITGKNLSKQNAIHFFKKLDSFPALRTSLYSQFFLNSLIIKSKATPSKDKFTDSLQIVGASYFTSIVSNDDYLLNNLSPAINPDLQKININSLF